MNMDAVRDIEFTQIAADWDSAPLGREKEPLLLLMRNGLTVEQSKERGVLRVTRIETISDGIIDETKVRSVSGLSTEQVEKYRIRKGDILFSHINSDPHLGKTAIASRNYADLLHGMNLLLLRVNKKVLEPQFLHFVCCYYRMKGVFVKICSRSVNQSSINQAKLKALEIPLPSLPEQHKIAGVLGVVQRAIEQQEQLLQLITELKKTLLHQLFTQGLRGEHEKQTEIGPVPESWEIVKIGSLGKVITGTTPKTKVPEYYSPPEVDFIAPADLGQTRQIYNSGKKISRRGLDVIRALPKEAVMCVCIGSSIGKVGMTSKADSATNQQINTIICNERHDPAFIYYLLSYFSEYWRSFATFGPVPILNKGAFEVINIAIPATKDEEVEIAQCITALDAKIEMHMRRKDLLTNLFRTLLHQLMTAQIRVNDLELLWEWRNETSLYGNLPLSSQ
ncbi:MAG: restriction endonuclease subunit S [Gammaproteobacteria bacterium]|nr:MAG: restriction endonuclease subunit S [Gammaproteobacteria bacterium]